MTTTPRIEPANRSGASGWIEAGLFAIVLSVLNLSYAYGHQIGAHPVAFLTYAMPIAAVTLLLVTGPGPDWRAIVAHPLSYAVGGGIIGMEAFYYLLLEHVSPTDGSLLVRLNVPVGMLLGVLLIGRRPSRMSIFGAFVVIASIAFLVPGLEADRRVLGLGLAATCALIMSLRSFAAEFHPWNRNAHTVLEKMRVTGLVLLVSSVIGVVLVFGSMALVAHGAMSGPPWLPKVENFLHLPTYLLALFMGVVVLTAIQYLGFSTVVKIRTENFLAATALIPIVTLVFQIAAVEIGLLEPVPVDWRTLPTMGAIMLGVILVVWGGRGAGHPAASATHSPPAVAPMPNASAPLTRPWAAMVAATLLGLPYGTIYAFSVLLKPLEALLDIPRTELSFVFGLSAIGFTAGMNLAPLAFGRLSATAILVLATVVNLAGIALAATATSTWQLALGYGVMFGVASGMAFTTYQQVVNLLVRGRQGLVNGYIVSLFPAGAMIGAPLLDWGIEHWGVRWALGGLGGVFAVTGIVAIALFVFSGARLEAPGARMRDAEGSADAGRRVVFWKIFAIFFVAAASGLLVLSQAAGIVAAYGGAGALAVFATTGITGAIAAARLTGGGLTDRFAVPYVMAGAQAMALIGTIILTLWPGPKMSVVSLAMIGMGYGIISGATAAAIGLYWEKRDFGRVASRLYIAWCIAAVTLPVLAARLFDETGGYATAIIVAGCGNLIGVLVAITLPRRVEGGRQSEPPAASTR